MAFEAVIKLIAENHASGVLGQAATAAKEYSTAVADATKGTTGFATTLGHVGVAAETVNKGGLKGLIATADLIGIAWTTVVPIFKSAGEAAIRCADDFANAAGGQKMLAEAVGSTVEEFSGFSAAVQLSGKELGNARELMGAMTGRMREALQTTGQLQGGWSNLGISLIDSNGKIKSSTELLYDLADAFQKMPDGAQKSALAIELLGEQGVKMIPILNQGSAALQAQAQYAAALGATFTKADGEMAEALKRSEARVSVFSEAAKNALGRIVTPAVTAGLEGLGDLAEKMFMSVASSAAGADLQLSKLAANQKSEEALQKFIAADRELMATLRQSETDIERNVGALSGLRGEIDQVVKEENRLKAAVNEAASVSEDWLGVQLESLGIQIEKRKALEENANALEKEIAAQEKSRIANYETLQSHVDTLEAMKKSIETSHTQTAADQLRIAKLNEVIEAERATLTLTAENDAVLQKHLETKKQELDLAAVGLERKNLLNKARAEEQAADSAVFNARAHQLALLNTGEQELSIARMKATDAVTEADRKFTADRMTRADQLRVASINAAKAVFDAETEMMTRAATIDQQVAKASIDLQGEILNAHIARITRQETAGLRAEKALMDAETQTEKMREEYGNLDLTRAERFKQAQIAHLQEIAGKELSTAVIRSRIADSTLIALEAHRDLEHEVAQATYDTLLTAAKANEFHKTGADMISSQASAAQITANGLGLNVDIAGELTSRLAGCGQATQTVAAGTAMIASGLQGCVTIADALGNKINLMAGSLTQIQAGMQMGPAGGVTKIGERSIQLPQQGLPGAAGMSAVMSYQAEVANAQALAEAKRREDERRAMIEANNKALEAVMTPAQRAAREQAEQIKAKKDEIANVSKNADFNRQMAELDLVLSNTKASQDIRIAPSLSGLRNQADILAQQSTILDTRRQIGNTPALSPGQNVLDLLNQKKAIADAERTLSNFGAMASGANTLDLLSQRTNILNTRRTLDNFDAMASGQNILDLLTQKTNVKNAARTLDNFDAMASGMNTLDLLSQKTNIKNTERTLSNFDQMAAGANVLDLMAQKTNIANTARTLDNFDAMASGMNVLDLLSQDANIKNVARTLSNFEAMASGANVLDTFNEMGTAMTSARKAGNYGQMMSGLNEADDLKGQLSSLEADRAAAKRTPYFGSTGGSSGRVSVADQVLEAIQKNPNSVAYRNLAHQLRIPGYSSGTGLEGVPGAGFSDSQPAMLTPREIVLNPQESDVVRALAKAGGGGGGVDYEQLTAAIVKALAGAMFRFDERGICKLLLRQTRDGRVTTYKTAVTAAK